MFNQNAIPFPEFIFECYHEIQLNIFKVVRLANGIIYTVYCVSMTNKTTNWLR